MILNKLIKLKLRRMCKILNAYSLSITIVHNLNELTIIIFVQLNIHIAKQIKGAYYTSFSGPQNLFSCFLKPFIVDS